MDQNNQWPDQGWGNGGNRGNYANQGGNQGNNANNGNYANNGHQGNNGNNGNQGWNHREGARERSEFSSGYGLREPNRQANPLPPDHERVTPHGSVHRIYPAPTPVAPASNADQGWTSPPSHQDNNSFGQKDDQDRHQGAHNDPTFNNQPHRSFGGQNQTRVSEPQPPAHQGVTAPTSSGAYVAWEPAQHSQTDKDAMAKLQEYFDQEMERRAERGIRGMFDTNRPQRDGAPASGPGGWTQPRQDQGWGSRNNTNDNDGGLGSQREQPPHFGGGGGGGRGCFNCGQDGHISRDCPQGGRTCHNCGEPGHISRECPQGGGARTCYGCGEPGHNRSECPQGGGGGGYDSRTCHNCGEAGHISRDCPSGGNSRTCHNCGETGHFASNAACAMLTCQSRECPSGGNRQYGQQADNGWGGNTGRGAVADDGWGNNTGGGTGGNDGWGRTAGGGGESKDNDNDGWGGGGQTGASANQSNNDDWGQPSAPTHTDNNGWGDNNSTSAPQKQPGGWGNAAPTTPEKVVNNNFTAPTPGPGIHPDRLRQMQGEQHARRPTEFVPAHQQQQLSTGGLSGPGGSLRAPPAPQRDSWDGRNRDQTGALGDTQRFGNNTQQSGVGGGQQNEFGGRGHQNHGNDQFGGGANQQRSNDQFGGGGSGGGQLPKEYGGGSQYGGNGQNEYGGHNMGGNNEQRGNDSGNHQYGGANTSTSGRGQYGNDHAPQQQPQQPAANDEFGGW